MQAEAAVCARLEYTAIPLLRCRRFNCRCNIYIMETLGMTFNLEKQGCFHCHSLDALCLKILIYDHSTIFLTVRFTYLAMSPPGLSGLLHLVSQRFDTEVDPKTQLRVQTPLAIYRRIGLFCSPREKKKRTPSSQYIHEMHLGCVVEPPSNN